MLVMLAIDLGHVQLVLMLHVKWSFVTSKANYEGTK